MITDSKLVQPLNADAPKLVTVLGMSIAWMGK